MAIAGILVTPEQLQSLSGRVSSSAGSIESELGGLSSSLAPLGSDWAGNAATSFTGLFQQWQTSAASLQRALQGISALLGQAGVAYADAEAQIASSFRVS